VAGEREGHSSDTLFAASCEDKSHLLSGASATGCVGVVGGGDTGKIRARWVAT
jgi:hypothetical protein